MLKLTAAAALQNARAVWRSPTIRRVRAVGRVAAYAGVLLCVFTLVEYKRAKAEIGEKSLQIGRDLLPLADLLQENNDLQINGERLMLSTATSKQSVTQVLDRYEAYCKEHPGAIGRTWGALENSEEPKLRQLASTANLGIVRMDKGDEGTVMCLTKGDGTPLDFNEAFSQFAATRDLGKLGRIRYVFARKSKQGNTLVFTLWSDDSFKLDALTPEGGKDTPGTDSSLVPRPENSKRILDARLNHTPYGVRIYTTRANGFAVMKTYDEKMKKAGWLKIHPDHANAGTRGYLKGNIQVVVTVGENEQENGEYIVSIAEAGAQFADQELKGGFQSSQFRGDK